MCIAIRKNILGNLNTKRKMIELMIENPMLRALILGVCVATLIAINKPKQR